MKAIAIQWLLSGPARLLVADVVRYDEVVLDVAASDTASHVTLTWLVVVVILIALALIGFKKSRRTHLD